ncbi:hypothetical protein L0P96_08435 [Anoxybacillus flavithermus]
MAEISKFFNSAPGDARTYQASDFADYFGSVLSTGLLHTDNIPALEVKCDGNDLRTYVTPGKAIMQGYLYENTSNLYLEHALPEATYDRIDRIVLRLDKRNQSRFIRAFVKQGTPSENPVPPDLQRDDFIYELSLAQIRVRANTSTLNPADLIDERLDENLCGLVHSLISIPTSQFQQQWDEFMAGIQDEGFASAEEFNAHLADNVSHVPYAVATGTANTYAVTLNPAPTAYVDGMAISVKIPVDSTGPSTLNVNGLGAKPLKKANGNDVTNLKANGVYTFRYNASTGNFIIQGEGGSGNAQPSDVLSGKTFTNDAGEQVGTMVNRGAMIITPTTSDRPIPQGYHNGSGVVKGDPDLIPANIKKGVNIFGAVGTLSPFHTVPDGSIGFAANIIDKNVIGYDYYYDKNTGNFIKLTASLGNYIEKKIYDKNGTLLSTQNIGSFPSQTRIARKTKSGIFVSTASNVYLIDDNGTILRSAPINGNIYNDNLIYDSTNDVYVGIGTGSYSGKAVLMTFTGSEMNFTSAVGFDNNTILNILQDGVIHGIRPSSSTSIYQFICIKNGSSWDMSVVTASNLSFIPVFLSHLVRLYGGMEK